MEEAKCQYIGSGFLFLNEKKKQQEITLTLKIYTLLKIKLLIFKLLIELITFASADHIYKFFIICRLSKFLKGIN